MSSSQAGISFVKPLTCHVSLPVPAVKPTKALPWLRRRVALRFSGTTKHGSYGTSTEYAGNRRFEARAGHQESQNVTRKEEKVRGAEWYWVVLLETLAEGVGERPYTSLGRSTSRWFTRQDSNGFRHQRRNPSDALRVTWRVGCILPTKLVVRGTVVLG